MKHRPLPPPPEQDDLPRPRLVDMIDSRHELLRLAGLIDWQVFEREWAGFFPSHKGRPATEPRLVAELLYIQDAYRLSDEAVVARWLENPYYRQSELMRWMPPPQRHHVCHDGFIGTEGRAHR